jgi:hypothetical protein
MIFENVSAILRSFTETLSKALAGGKTPLSPQPPLAAGILTASGLSAFVSFVAPLVHIVEGKGTLADDEEAANVVMDVITALDPASTPVIAMIEAAEPVFATLVSLATADGFHITGGYPDIVGMENDRNFKNR